VQEDAGPELARIALAFFGPPRGGDAKA
jgi:hypothetical protein